MAFSDDFIQQIRESVDIVDEIGQVVDLKKQGKNHFACCPFHDEKTPSFSVEAEKQLYFCHGACGEGGDVFQFTMKYHNVDFPEAVAKLAQRAGIPLEDGRSTEQRAQGGAKAAVYAALEEAKSYYQEQLTGHEAAQELLRRRGVTPETVETFALGAAPAGWRGVIDRINPEKNFKALVDSGLAVYRKKTATEKGRFYDRFRDSVIFPIRDERGRVASFAQRRLSDAPGPGGKTPPKYVNGQETDVFKKSAIAYGLYEALQANRSPEQLFVTEGYMDVVTSHQSGLSNTVATMGVAINTDLAKRLFKHTDQLTFCFDGDAAGREAASRALHAVLPLLNDEKRASFVFLPQGQDPDSMIREQGVEAYSQYVKLNASPASDVLLRLAREGIPSLDTSEARGQLFSNAKVMLDKMPASVTKGHILKRLETVTAIKPTEYMPFSLELREGHCHGVDLPALETEVRDFIAQRIGVSSGEVKVSWSMPELGPNRAPSAPKIGEQGVQQELSVRMREVGRILTLDTPVSQGLSLKQLVRSVRSAEGEHQVMAKALLSRYLRDTPAFETECQLASYHMSVVEHNLKQVAPTMNQQSTEQLQRWLSSVQANAVSLNATLQELDPASAGKVEHHLSAIQGLASQTLDSIEENQVTNKHQAQIAASGVTR